jgi:hypothetical protein
MAKRKNAAALFEVIHADKRFAPRRAVWTMPSPFGWLRRRGNGDASVSASDMMESAPSQPAEPSQPSRLWSLIPPMPRMLLDPDRHVVDLKLSYTTALVSAFAVVAIIALAFVVGKHSSHQKFPSLADQTTDELRSGPAQPDVLDVGPETAPMAMAAQQRPANRTVTAPPPVAPPQAQLAQRANWNDPKPPTTHMDDSRDRVVNYNYVIVQSYPEQEKQMAQDACDLLSKRGIPCTVETGLHYAPNWHIVVGLKGFDRVRNSPEYDDYVRKIEEVGVEFAGNSKFKKFEPRAFKWQQPKATPAKS